MKYLLYIIALVLLVECAIRALGFSIIDIIQMLLIIGIIIIVVRIIQGRKVF